MATQVYTISDSEVTIKYRQPYVSEALNRKGAIVPRGVVRGLVPRASTTTNDTLVLHVDTSTLDSVVNGAGLARAGAVGDYYVTWRTVGNVEVPITANGQLVFIVFVPGYQFGSATAPKIMSLTEGEFEAGDHEGLGGVLLCAVKANAVAGLLDEQSVITAGLTNGTRVPFVREDNAINCAGDRRSERLAYFTNFDKLSSDMGLTSTLSESQYTAGWRMDVVQWTATTNANYEPESGSAVLRLKRVGGLGTATITGERFKLCARNRGNRQRLSVWMWYKGVSYSVTGTAPTLSVLLNYNAATDVVGAGTSAIPQIASCIAPVGCGEVSAATSTWNWLCYEVSVPNRHGINGSAIQSGQLQIEWGGVADNSELIVDRLFVLTEGVEQAQPSVGMVPVAMDSEQEVGSSLVVSNPWTVNTQAPSYKFEIAEGSLPNGEMVLTPSVSHTGNLFQIGQDGYYADPVSGVSSSGRYMKVLVKGNGSTSYGLEVNKANLKVLPNGTSAGNVTIGGSLSLSSAPLVVDSAGASSYVESYRYVSAGSFVREGTWESDNFGGRGFYVDSAQSGGSMWIDLNDFYAQGGTSNEVELMFNEQVRVYAVNGSFPTTGVVAVGVTVYKVDLSSGVILSTQAQSATGAELSAGGGYVDLSFSAFSTSASRSLQRGYGVYAVVSVNTNSNANDSCKINGVEFKARHKVLAFA